MAAQAPDTAAAEVKDGYITAWAAITRMLARGRSLSGHEPNTCFLNLGSGGEGYPQFADISGAARFDFPDDARAMALTDWDFDGDLDVWLLNRSAPQLRLLRNSKPDGGHFVAFLLDAPAGNRDAIGARVVVELKGDADRGIVRSRSVVAGAGFLSQSTRWLHFGLGAEKPEIVGVRVRWPDGSQQIAGPIAADRFYQWTKGAEPRKRKTPASWMTQAKSEPAELPPVEDTAVARVVLTGRPVLPRVSAGVRAIAKPTLVTLWASWCKPCMTELKDWWDQRDRFAAQGLDVLTLNIDDADEGSGRSQDEIARSAQQKIGVAFPTELLPAQSAAVVDFFQQSQMALQTPLALPTSFLVDAHGRVSVIYKGGVAPEQILRDLELLDIAEDERPDRAVAFPGRWLRLPRGEDANVVAARLQDEGLTFEAIRYVETAIELMQSGHGSRRARPTPELWFTLARLRLQAGDRDGALVAYRKTLSLDPDHLGANMECGKLLFDFGEPAEAKPLLEAAIGLDPNASGSINLLALVELQIGTPARAIELAERSVEISPGDASANFTLGLSYQQAGRWRSALAAYRRTIELNQSWLVARSNMAWILSTAPDASVRDGPLALKLARPLAKLKTRDRPLFLRTLAAAYAETADFEQAANIVRQTLNELGPNAHPLKGQLREDLRSYAAGKPVRIRALME